MVDGWEITIADPAGKPVKSYKSLPELELRNLDFGKVVSKIFSRKQSVEIPKSVVWDGLNENTGKIEPDGIYSVKLKAWDENKNTAETGPVSIRIDTVVPVVEASPNYLIFSPNNDGVKDDITFSIKSSGIQDGDPIHAAVKHWNGETVRKWDFTSKAPDKIVWDGKDDSGKICPEGEYSFSIAVTDEAANHGESFIEKYALVTNYQKCDTIGDLAVFSPNGDGSFDSLDLKNNVSDPKGLERWTLTFRDGKNTPVRVFQGTAEFPQEIVWDGKDDRKKLLPDGNYSYQLELYYDSGNFPKSAVKTVEILNTPPQIAVDADYTAFSPNGDGKQDFVTFTQSVQAKDNTAIEVRIADNSGSPVYFNQMKRSEFPETFVWNGLDKNMSPLPDGKYTYTITAVDMVGNRSTAQIKDIVLKSGLEKASIQSDTAAFSPGNTNAVSKVVFTPKLTSADGLQIFLFEIRDASGNVVKSLNSNASPATIPWDGRDNSGKTLPDGSYIYTLKLKYSFGDEPVSSPKIIRIDTAAPVIACTADDTIFSPNNDGRKETLTIRQETKGEPGDQYDAAFIDGNNKTVRKYHWTGKIPENLVWNGLDDAGKDAPEGLYRYEIQGVDAAGNRAVKSIQSIQMVRTFETLDFEASRGGFSPFGDLPHEIQLLTAISSVKNLSESRLTLYNDSGTVVREFSRKGSPIDATNIWDAKDNKGVYADDGNYTAEAVFDFASGNHIVSVISNLVLDKTPPVVQWNIAPELFTPDNDGDNDILYINLGIGDNSDVRNWELDISKKPEGTNRNPIFKKFAGNGPVKQLIEWNGLSDDGQDLVEAVQDYTANLSAEDIYGNKTNLTKNISVGVLVEKLPDGLRIRVSSILFAFDKETFVGDFTKPLDKVITILRTILADPKKYGITENYKIEVSGHTDDVGTDEYNLKLSERRAKAVYDYLIRKDIDPKILTSVGYGKTRQYKIITPDMSKEKKEEYRARNRRVEFFIRK